MAFLIGLLCCTRPLSVRSTASGFVTLWLPAGSAYRQPQPPTTFTQVVALERYMATLAAAQRINMPMLGSLEPGIKWWRGCLMTRLMLMQPLPRFPQRRLHSRELPSARLPSRPWDAAMPVWHYKQ